MEETEQILMIGKKQMQSILDTMLNLKLQVTQLENIIREIRQNNLK